MVEEKEKKVEREDSIDKKRKGEEGGNERKGKKGDKDKNRIEEEVEIEKMVIGKKIGEWGSKILIEDLLKKRIIGEKCSSWKGRKKKWS